LSTSGAIEIGPGRRHIKAPPPAYRIRRRLCDARVFNLTVSACPELQGQLHKCRSIRVWISIHSSDALDDPLTNNLCRQLRLCFPAFGLAHRIELVAAISRTGSLGVYAAARDDPSEL